MPHVQIEKVFLVNRATGQQHRIDGLKKSDHKSARKSLCRDFTKHVIYKTKDLPPKVDLRPWMTAVDDQASLGSCTANAIAGLLGYMVKKRTEQNDKKNDKLPPIITDSGCPIVASIEALKRKGTCRESVWPYDEKKVNVKPSKECFQAGKQNAIIEALEVDAEIDEMRSCLAQGFPFVFGLDLYPSFNKAESNGGAVPLPDMWKTSQLSHAMLAVGYSDFSQAFIVRNSWGTKWGDQGYCYIPYAYMTNKNLCTSLYTVKQITGNTLGTEQWIMQDQENYRTRGETEGPHPADDDDDQFEFIETTDEDEYELEDDEGGDDQNSNDESDENPSDNEVSADEHAQDEHDAGDDDGESNDDA